MSSRIIDLKYPDKCCLFQFGIGSATKLKMLAYKNKILNSSFRHQRLLTVTIMAYSRALPYGNENNDVGISAKCGLVAYVTHSFGIFLGRVTSG